MLLSLIKLTTHRSPSLLAPSSPRVTVCPPTTEYQSICRNHEHSATLLTYGLPSAISLDFASSGEQHSEYRSASAVRRARLCRLQGIPVSPPSSSILPLHAIPLPPHHPADRPTDRPLILPRRHSRTSSRTGPSPPKQVSPTLRLHSHTLSRHIANASSFSSLAPSGDISHLDGKGRDGLGRGMG